jgi:hypothetical protein
MAEDGSDRSSKRAKTDGEQYDRPRPCLHTPRAMMVCTHVVIFCVTVTVHILCACHARVHGVICASHHVCAHGTRAAGLPATYVEGFHDRGAVERMPYRPLGGETGLEVSILSFGVSECPSRLHATHGLDHIATLARLSCPLRARCPKEPCTDSSCSAFSRLRSVASGVFVVELLVQTVARHTHLCELVSQTADPDRDVHGYTLRMLA